MRSKVLHYICTCTAATLLFCSIAIAGETLSDTGISATEETVVCEESREPTPPAQEPERPAVVVAGNIDPVPARSGVYYDIALSEQKQDIVKGYCETYDVPLELVFGIMSVESSFSVSTVSDTQDYGIMQINVINHDWLARELGITDFLDFEQNVHGGVFMLAEYYHKYGDINKIAMCYHYGESGALERWNTGMTSDDYTSAVVCAIAGLKKVDEK